MKNKKIEEVIIVGAGPAGIAAAMQFNKFNIRPILIEKSKIGGLLRNANHVENYPGFPNGISGSGLVSEFSKQLNNKNIEYVFEEVERLSFSEEVYIVKTNDNEYYSKSVIVATGTKPRIPQGIEIHPSASEFIFTEAADLFNESSKSICIIGAGDAAFDYVLTLSKKNEVCIFNRANEVKCNPVLNDEVKNKNNIGYMTNINVEKIELINDKLVLNCKKKNVNFQYTFDLVVTAVGRDENISFLSENLHKAFKNEDLHDSIKFAGDVKNGIYRQTAISVGDGVKAAMEIYDFLKRESKK